MKTLTIIMLVASIAGSTTTLPVVAAVSATAQQSISQGSCSSCLDSFDPCKLLSPMQKCGDQFIIKLANQHHYKCSTPQGHHISEGRDASGLANHIFTVTCLQSDGASASYQLNNGKPCIYKHSTPQGQHVTTGLNTQVRNAWCVNTQSNDLYTITYLQPDGTPATYPLNNGQPCSYEESTPQGHHITGGLNARRDKTRLYTVTYQQSDGTLANYQLNNGKPCNYQGSTSQGHHITEGRDASGCANNILTVIYLQSDGALASYQLNNGKPCIYKHSTPQGQHVIRDLSLNAQGGCNPTNL